MKKLQDERVISERRRIGANAFGICVLGLLGILMYRQLILNQSFKEVRDIHLLLCGVTLYVAFKLIKSGIYLSHNKKKQNTKLFVVSGTIATIVFVAISSMFTKRTIPNDIPEIIIGAVTFFIAWIVVQIGVIKLSQKQANKDIE